MEKIGEFILVIMTLLLIGYILLIPFNINKIANELEDIKKSLKKIAAKED